MIHKKGFTLVEVLVATVLIVVLGLAIVGLQYVLGQSQVFVWRTTLNVDQANANVQSLVRELRTARPGDNGAYPLELVLDQEIIFYSDIDFDNKTEKVRYFLSGSTLNKEIIKPTEYPVSYPPENEKTIVLTDNVRNHEVPIFYYFNGDWPKDTENNPLPLPARLSETKLMYVFLRLNTEDNKPEKDFILESYSQIRMLKENL